MQPPYTKAANDALPLFDRGVSCLCWAYNEEECIRDFLLRIHAMLRASCADYEIVVIDDCSMDRTNEIVRELKQSIPQISLYRNETNRNVGYSCQRAIREAKKEFLFWQTVDWSYDITLLRTFLEFLKTDDVVAGVRRAPVSQRTGISKIIATVWLLFGRHLTKRSDTLSKAIVSISNYLIIRLLYRFPLSDYQNVVFYRTALIQSLKTEADSSFANPELLLKSHWRGASIKEVPISFIPRVAGEAKGTRLGSIMKSVRDVFGFWLKWVVLGGRGKVTKGAIARLNPAEW
ncbi:MAG: glycosyltransferase family 2 protein, partial [Humidesulfovibrio sp.]|uniref:glycosyltransferase family 2 protein n=1 Tax=Humidesulfovibrio sp. TaxID=2910988 RepID=UPI002734AE58